jgi:hypothetical protein
LKFYMGRTIHDLKEKEYCTDEEVKGREIAP